MAVTQMAVTTIPDIYVPSVDDDGNYCDGIFKYVFENSIKCPCSNRIYLDRTSFSQHVKTKVHQKWLEELNKNKNNYYEKYCELHKLANEQKLIIGKLEKEIQKKNKCIIDLTMKLLENNGENQDMEK